MIKIGKEKDYAFQVFDDELNLYPMICSFQLYTYVCITFYGFSFLPTHISKGFLIECF